MRRPPPGSGKWFEEVIEDIKESLDQADRFDTDTRRIRGELAFFQLDFMARGWMRHGCDAHRDRAVEQLADSWMHLLSDVE